MAEEEFRWEQVDGGDLTVGMYVRGTPNPFWSWTAEPVEGEIVALVGTSDVNIAGDYEQNGSRDKRSRAWVRRLPVAQDTPAQATGRWVSAEHGEFSVGDRVRVTSRETGLVDEAVVEATTCNTGEGSAALVIRRDDGRVHCRHAQYRTFEKWVVEATIPAFTWVTVPSTELVAGDYARGTAQSGNAIEGTVQSVSAMGYVRLNVSPGNLSPNRTWERHTPVASASTPTPDAAPAQAPEYTWVEVTADDLVRGDTVRALGFPTDAVGQEDVWQEGEFTSITTSGGYRYARINGNGCDVRRRFMRRTLVTADTQSTSTPSTVTITRPQVGDHFTRTFNTPTAGNPPRREGCVVTSVRDVGDAPGQDLWVITYSSGLTDWDLGLLVRPDGTCEPNDPAEGREGRDLTGRYEPVVDDVEPSTEEWVPLTRETLRVGDVVRARPGGIGGLMQAEVIAVRRGENFHARTIEVITPSRRGREADMSGPYDRGYYTYGYDETNPAPLVRRAASATPTSPAPEAGAWVDVDTLLLTEGDRARWRYDSGAEWHEVTVREVDSDGDVYIEGSRDYITGSRNKDWQRWVPTPTQADGTPLPDWATSLDAARRHVHARARQLFTSRDNCASGTADFLSAAGLPDFRRDYPAPPDETEQIREFLTLVREAAITTANRHGKSMSQVHTWLRREGITEPPPPPVTHTLNVQVPAGTTSEDIVRALQGAAHPSWRIV